MLLRKYFTIAACALTVFGCLAQTSYTKTQEKAERFFNHQEWASALAMYNFMLNEEPKAADTYGRAIVSAEMLGDTIRSKDLLDQAMNYGVSLDSLLTKVKHYSFKIGEGNLYERFMLSAAAQHIWMERPLDAYLLRYYAFRRNGEEMVAYAQKMLRGAPNDVKFMLVEADGYMIDGKQPEAVAAWQKVLSVDENNEDAILHLANYYELADDPTNALFYYKRALALRPTPYVNAAVRRIEGKNK